MLGQKRAAKTTTKAAEEKPPKSYVFWEGDGTESPRSQPIFHEESTIWQPIFSVVADARYKADKRLQVGSRMNQQQINLSTTVL
jgi:hypothetical protein